MGQVLEGEAASLVEECFADRGARIIAIMLGPLRMTVAQCLKAYRAMTERAFTPISDGFLG